jgi:RNA-directed DNA polymerase
MYGEQWREEMVERGNMWAALRQVRATQGSPGGDAMRVDALPDLLKMHWLESKDQLLQGTDQPQGRKRVERPQPGSQEQRKLGLPCVRDRRIPQAILHGLQWRWAPTFSARSDGFRPGRSAHQAVAQAQAYIAQGYSAVVDLDGATFFDRVCHDRLLSRLAERITDTRVLQLIRASGQAGRLDDGVTTVPREGTPQGSPRSPFRSNVVLDEFAKELEARGLRFCRYADDRAPRTHERRFHHGRMR